MNISRPLILVGLGAGYIGYRRGWFHRFRPQFERARSVVLGQFERARKNVRARMAR